MNLLIIFNKIREWILLCNPEWSNSLKNCKRLQYQFIVLNRLGTSEAGRGCSKSLICFEKSQQLSVFPRLVPLKPRLIQGN
jgi:hypothetical protein